MNAERISASVIPLIVGAAAALALVPKKKYFDAFLAGAKEGAATCFGLLPTMAALMVAVSMLSASGALELLVGALSPVGEAVGIPSELIPLLITRPVSGSASNAAFMDMVARFGADSFPALCAAVIMGSSDTMIYTISVYFSATTVRRTAHTVPVAVAVMLICVFLSCSLCRVLF